METTPSPLRISLWWTYLAISALSFTPSILYSQCDTEVSGVFTYCNAVGTPGTTGYFVAFRILDLTGDTLNVVDLNGNNVTNRGKRVNDINTDNEPATVTIVPARITGIGADTIEYWYFGPYPNGSTFDIALVDPSGICDTVFVASGTYNCTDNTGLSDPGACDNDVPLYFLDFSQTEFNYGGGGGGNENFDEIFLIMPRTRESVCCDLQPANQACFEFIIRLGDDDIGLAIDDVGSGSPGGEIYADTLNAFTCTGSSPTTWPFTQSGGQSQDLPLCLIGQSGQEFVVLSCKSGGNVTGASIDAISNIFAPPVVTTEPCNAFLEVFNADTVMWSSPDDPNLDNLLSCTGDSILCTFLYDAMVFGEITECAGDTFYYIVGSMPGGNECFDADTVLFDTTYVIVYPVFTVEIDSMCNATGDSLLLTANVMSAATGCEYVYLWSSGETTQSITVDFSNTEYFVSVTRGDVAPELQECSVAVDSIVADGALMISCVNIGDTLYTCVNELPDADTTLVTFTGCTNPDMLVFVVDESNNGSGCIGDTLTISRYYIVDFDGDTVTTTTDQDTCVQLLSFVDNVAPVITSGCPPNVTVSCASQVPAPAPETLTAADNCGESVVITHAGDVTSNQTCANRFIITRTYRATDECGNSSTCNQTISVEDNTAPSITCPPDMSVECASEVPLPNPEGIVTTDNCGTSSAVFFGDNISNQTCVNRYTISRTYRATDACGNTASCVQTITVFDDTPPSITCPPPITVECANLIPPPNASTVIANDNCGQIPQVMHFSDVTVTIVCANNFTMNRTYIATDACGNTATCIQAITVSDDTPPLITCPANITINSADDSSPEGTGNPGASDNCGGAPLVTFNDVTVEDDCPGDYTITRTWTATDECQNSATCIQQIEVEGTCNVDLALVKNIDPGQGAISGGENVNFTITVTNEGLVSVGSITIVDYIPDGFVLNDLDWVAGVAGSTGQSASIILSEANGALPSGGLQSMQTVSVQITLQAAPDITSGLYINIAEITAVFDTNGNDVTNNDVDSNPDTDDTNDPPAEDDHDPEMICVLAIPVILGDMAVCSGDTTTYTLLDYNAANSYMWTISGGGIIIENNDSSIVVSWIGAPGGPFTIMVVETAGPDCQATGTLNVSIQGGEAIACLDHVNLSIDNECGTVVTSGMILTGDQTGNNNFTVYVIDMNGDTVPNATLTFMHVGQTFKVSVVSECSGQSCWGFLTVEDKLPPQLMCACPVGNEFESCEISCLLIDEFLNGEIPLEMQPVPVDNCGGTTVQIVDIDLNFETCTGGYFHVTWLATDVAGNTSTCVQEFPIVPLTLETLVFPADFFGDCRDSSDPDSTGWPTVDGLELSDVPSHCNIIATYTDNEFDLCGGGRKIIRTWRVFDWCVPETREFVQFIILADTTGPVLTCPADLTVGTDVWFCYANVLVPKPAVTDDCSAIKRFHLFSPAGTVVTVGSNFRINNLPIGTHTLTWTVYDECHNSSSCSFEITVIDNVPPVPACQQHLIVSLTNDRPNGITLIPATVFNDGSFDNCTAVTFRARRMQSCIDIDWTTNGACVDDIPGGIPPLNARDYGTVHGLCVPFACCDVNAGPIMVELEVTDGAGNVNYCMVEVEVQDKLPPVVTCPPDITISCAFEVDVVEGLFRDVDGNNNGTLDEDPLSEVFGNMFDAFRHDESARESIIINDPGNDQFVQPFNWGIDGWATDNCGANLTVEVTEYSDCSGETLPGNPPTGAIGLITRRFRAIDDSGNPSQGTCLQRIWIIDYDPFYITDTTCANSNPNDGVIWPCDVLLNTCPEEISGTGEPIILDDLCSLIGVSFEDTRFDFADGSCYKILREWFILDWCQFDANTGAGIWSYTQTIKVADAFGPELLNCPQGPVELCIGDPGVTLPANNQILLGENNPNSSSCSAHLTMSQSVRELCSESVIYDVKLYPFNGTEFIQLKPETVLPLDANNIGVMTFNTTQSTMQSIAQNGLPYNDAFCGDYHRLLWTVEDGCGNLSFCDHLIRLEDCKDPTPVCLNGISTMIMPMTGEVTIWASDFNASSVDDCTPSEALLYSFSENSYQPSFTYTCENVPEFGEPIEEEIWVADGGRDQNCNGTIEWSERNTDVCVTYIIITDSLDVCDEQGLVLAGEIMTEHTDAVSPATVNLTGPSGGTVKVTGTDGRFTFVNVHPGDDYTIKPERNDDHRNGVSTMDLVRIQKHLLGREVFSSPYQYIAADANSSGSVSAIDLVEIRKLVLGVTTGFAYNKSWRFVKSGSEMTANHPWPFEETIEVQDLTNENLTDLDFVGVKIGDVNNTVKANAFQYLPRNSRRVLNMQATGNGHLKEGGLLEIKLSTTELLSGFQWTLETNGLEFVAASSELIDIDHSNIGIHENGMVTMSWNSTNATTSHEVSLVLTFKVTHGGELKDMLKVSSSITEAEAYTSTGEILDVNLEFSGEELSSEFALYQNHPNPWNGHTVIGFDLPADAYASLIIYDVAGKIIKTIEGDYKKGYNTILISTREISAPGVLYYRLESEGYSATKKMLIIQ